MLHTCAHCGKEFDGYTKRKYCSRECSTAVNSARLCKKVITTCTTCGKPIERSPSGAKGKNGVFCSKKCWYVVRDAIVKDTPYHPKKRVNRICQQCGKEFDIIPSALKRNDTGRFCSRACQVARKREITGTNHPLYTSVKHTCEWCGEEYTVKKVHEHRTRFCSQQCQGAYTVANAWRKRTYIEVITKDILDEIGIPYEQEKPINRFICDFYISSHRLVIECDGTYWHGTERQKQKDARRDAWLKARAFTVLRLPEREIANDKDGCKQRIINTLAKILKPNGQLTLPFD